MRDAETGSLWSHLLGEAMQGPLKGARLEVLAGVMTDWKTWRKEHPDTTVVTLPRTAREFRRELYRKPERFVLGIVENDDVAAYPFDALDRRRVANDRVGDEALAVFYSDGDDEKIVAAKKKFLDAFTIGPDRVDPPKLLLARVTREGIEEL